uniref:Uncharacterized protein n=1 Tax=Thermosporothrix sp. COM3 TaxID=2490863 RepID=A0A455S9Z5_9CHLR|nr:hypothetical protein KTC_00280 [Thermosporothrix sp. COM3]
MGNIPKTTLEIKHELAAQAIECGTLEIFTQFLRLTPVFLMPLERARPLGNQYQREWAVHVTTRPYPNGPVYYATFLAAQAFGGLGGERSWSLVFPDRLKGTEALELAHQLQEELQTCLRQVLERAPLAGKVICPARYRLPDEWVWSVQSTAASLVYREGHWRLAALP